MSKWIRSLALATAVAVGTAGLVTVSGTVAQGQGKDTKPKTPEQKPKPPEPKAGDGKGTVTVAKDKQGKFRYYVKDAAGKTLLMGPVGFEKADEAIAALEKAKAILNAAKPVVEKDGK